MLEHRSDNPALHRLRNTANRGPGKLVVPCSKLKTFGPRSFVTTGAIPLEQLANRSHRRDAQHFYLQEQTQNISIQTVSPGRIETLHQLHERLCDGLAIKKRYINVLYITHYIMGYGMMFI